jgi:hypothetical protein
MSSTDGAIAQLVEHLHGMQGVRSSSLLGSIELNPEPDWVLTLFNSKVFNNAGSFLLPL